MKRDPPARFGIVEAFLLAALLVPPALRLSWPAVSRRLGLAPETPAEASPTDPARDPSAFSEDLASLRESLRLREEELAAWNRMAEVAGQAPTDRQRYRFLPVEPLPLDDSWPTRHAMWVALPFEVDPLLLRSSAVVADGRLLGRVVDAPGVVRVAQVETVADPLFRVRFRSATTQGIAAGSGQKDAEGQALLEVEHLETSEELPLGAALFTAGGDGIYPPGVLVGEVCAAASEAAGGRTLVRAAADAEPPMRLFVVCDLARRELMGVVLGAPGDGAAPEATGR